ncbi:hypothetical protein AVEN_43476-1 [Araneus ventricosus]|uniref:Uncharacterized protein n=1 Tax=Araneus ventricosus TaxID=182803 RepID=A0A4Y2GT45_ARAVE|nr:hypothetical protein AVEN_43476-1 [Araneus ventricosus]
MVVWNVVKDWGLEDEAQILCSNITSSNTGHINGPIAFLEQYADREMTFSISASHVQISVTKCFRIRVPQVTSSPKVVFYKRIREKRNNLEKENHMDGCKYLKEILSESKILSNVNYLSNGTKNEKLKHHYRELIELYIVLLEGTHT